MKTENKVYDAPQVEIVEIEVEQAILIESGIPGQGEWE